MKILKFLLILILFTSCSNTSNIKGKFYCEECSMFKSLLIDDEIVDMGLLGSGTYYIKNNNLYVNWYGGVAKFEIIDKNTLKSLSTMINEGEVYTKKSK